MKFVIDFLPIFGLLALLFVFIKNNWIAKQEIGTEKMAIIAENIAKGAMSFLKAEYRILSIFVVCLALLLYIKGSNEEGSHGMVAL
ncbi:MAG: sodium-translocating pyrophosphatase, partial [Flavobacteriaceae bacterium TMED42]